MSRTDSWSSLPKFISGRRLGGLVSGAVAMALFIWRKDLLAMMVFHMSADALGLIVAPLFSEWWKEPALF